MARRLGGIEMAEDKMIYVITTMQFGMKYLNKNRSADGYYHSYEKRLSESQREYFTIIRKRTWGWYSKLDDARDCVAGNITDIHEEGYYQYALIEGISEGVLYGGNSPIEYWYKWNGNNKYGWYKPTKKPKKYENIIGFMDQIRKCSV